MSASSKPNPEVQPKAERRRFSAEYKRRIAVSTSLGIGIYPIESAPIGVDGVPTGTIPGMSVFVLEWSPDGRWLAGGHEDGTVRVWDVTGDDR